jgi:hypothetical protein
MDELPLQETSEDAAVPVLPGRCVLPGFLRTDDGLTELVFSAIPGILPTGDGQNAGIFPVFPKRIFAFSVATTAKIC